MNNRPIRGAKKGGGGNTTPKEEVNDLRSKTYVRALHLLGWGEYEGLVRQTPGLTKTCDIERDNAHIGCDPTGISVGQAVEGEGIQSGTTVVSLDVNFITVDLPPYITDSEVTLRFGASTGEESIYLDETPLKNADGTYNFSGVKWALTPGYATQGYMTGFDTVENYVSVGVKLKKTQSITRTITNSEADKLVVQIRLARLYEQKDNGDRVRSTVQFKVYVKLNAGSFTLVKDWTIYGKCVSEYLEETEFTLERSATPATDTWQVKLERVTDDHDGSTKYGDESFWESYSEVTTRKFRYPNMALFGIEADAENFSRTPQVGLKMRLKRIRVPANYTPETRTYATSGTGTTNGGWDGTFKVAYSNNPAWVIYDLITNNEYGAAKYVPTILANKWTLYAVAQYCDRMVPDGNGGTEPLFTCNVFIQSQEAAEKVLSDFASISRSALFYSRGYVDFAQDKPKAVFTQFNNSDVKDGVFYYTSTSRAARKTVARVRYNDPNDFYRPKIQVYEDPEMIRRYGYIPVEISAFGCTSPGQAYRMGALTIESEKRESEGVKFTTGIRAMSLQPGTIISLYDKDRQQLEAEGRTISAASTTSVTLDKPIVLVSGRVYTLTLVMPKALTEPADITDSTQTASVETSQVEAKTVSTAAGTNITVLTVSSAFSSVPTAGSVWILSSDALAAQKFRVLSVEREDNGFEFTVGGLLYSELKFDEAERDPDFTEVPTINYPVDNAVGPVRNLVLSQRAVTTPENVTNYIEAGWTAPANYPYIKEYAVYWSLDGGPFTALPPSLTPGASIPVSQPGTYYVRVTAVSALNGATSIPASASLVVQNQNPVSRFRVTGLELYNQGQSSIFGGKDAHFTWRLNAPSRAQELGSETNGAQDGQVDPYFNHFLVKVYDADGSLVFTDRTPSPFYIYTFELNKVHRAPESTALVPPFRQFTLGVSPVDRYNNVGTEARLAVANPAPSLPSLTAEPLLGAVNFKFSFPNDTDFRGYRIWASTVSGFTPSDSNLVYDGPDSQPTIKLTAGTTHYYKYAAYDAFGTDGITTSAELSVTPLLVLDTVPPAVPTGLAVTSELVSQPDGTQIVKLILSWTANVETDFLAYEWQVKETAGSPFSWVGGTALGASTVRAEIYGKPNTSYSARIRASDRDGNLSVYSAEVVATSTRDTTAPSTPTWSTCTVAFRNAYLSWANPTDSDFAYVELWENTANDFSSALKIRDNIRAASEVISYPATGQLTSSTRYYWLVARDTSSNASVTSAVQSLNFGGVPVPANLSVTSAAVQEVNGVSQTYLTATVDASAHAEFSSFTWEITLQSDGSTVHKTTTTSNTLRIPVAGNIAVNVAVRTNDSNNGRSAYTSAIAHTTAKDTSAPAVPANFTAVALSLSVMLEADIAPEADWVATNIYRSVTPSLPLTPTVTLGKTNTYADFDVSQGFDYYYGISYVDSSGNESTIATFGPVQPGKVESTDLADFAVTATKMFNHTIVLDGDFWTDNSPSAGKIAWNSHTLYYQGAAYTIAAGSTNAVTGDAYIYWTSAAPTSYFVSPIDSYPSTGDGGFIIATNVNGLHDLAWNALANAVIGTAFIADLAVTNAKILSLAVDKLTAGTVTAQEIIIAGGTAGKIRSADYSAGTAGWSIWHGGAEFNNVTVRGNLAAGTISIGSGANDVFKVDSNGNIWAGHANFASAPFKVTNAGVLTASGATITGSIEASALKVATVFVLGDASNTTNSVFQSYGFVSGSAGFRVRGNGDAEFNNITIRGAAIISGNIGATAVTTVEAGALRANAGLNSSGDATRRVVPSVNAAPSGSGLYLGSDYMGFYNGSAWRTYMDNAGNFYLGGTSGALQWNGTALTISGSILATSTIDGVAASTVTTGAARANAGLDNAGKLLTAVLPGAAVGASPASPGLYLGSDYMGYYNSGWKTYMDNAGNFYLGGTSGSLTWNGSTLAISGRITSTDGTIGGFTLGPTILSATNIELSSSAPHIRVGNASGERAIAEIVTGRSCFSTYNSGGTMTFRVQGNDGITGGSVLAMRDSSGTPTIGMTAASGELVCRSIARTDASNFFITTNGTTRMTLGSSGVWLPGGTDLTVTGNSYVTGTSYLTGNVNMYGSAAVTGSLTTGDIYLGTAGGVRWLYDANNNHLLKERASGYTGIGTLSLTDITAILRHHGLCDGP